MAYRISNGYVDVCEDDYENGCSLKSWAQEFPNNLYRKTFETQEELKALIAEGFYMDAADVDIIADSYDDEVRFTVSTLVDDDNLQPSDFQLEQWKRGEIKLYCMDIYFNVEKVEALTAKDLKQLL